jgi:hypothetical protein
MPDDRFITSYSIWGTRLDIERLLTTARPTAKNKVWRRGDPTVLGTPAVTSGLTIWVFHGSSESALHAAVKRFLKREARFVRVARHRTRAGAHSGLTTFISVGSSEEIPVGLELSAPLLALLAKAGVTWTVTASVFADGSRPDVGEGAPSKR